MGLVHEETFTYTERGKEIVIQDGKLMSIDGVRPREMTFQFFQEVIISLFFKKAPAPGALVPANQTHEQIHTEMMPYMEQEYIGQSIPLLTLAALKHHGYVICKPAPG